MAQGGARELAVCLQDVPRKLFQQPLRPGRAEAVRCAEGRAADAVHASGKAVAVVQAGNFGHSFAHNKARRRDGPDAGTCPATPDRSRSATARWARCPARDRHSPFNAGNRGGNNGKFSKIRAGSTTIRCGPATGTCSTTARVISAAGWAADASASASPRAHRACRSPAVRLVAADRLAAAVRSEAAASGGADRALQTMQNRAEHDALPGFRLRRDDQATSLANRSASTLPPESTMTTFLPLTSMRPASSAARPTAPPGSTTSFNSR